MISTVSLIIPPLSCLLITLPSLRTLTICMDDCSDLHKDLDAALDWSSKLLLHPNHEKCAALSTTNKHFPIMHTYQLNGHPIIWSPVIRYLHGCIAIYLIISELDRSLFTDYKRSFKYLELYSSCYVYMHL